MDFLRNVIAPLFTPLGKIVIIVILVVFEIGPVPLTRKRLPRAHRTEGAGSRRTEARTMSDRTSTLADDGGPTI